jgi:hypothetical protein
MILETHRRAAGGHCLHGVPIRATAGGRVILVDAAFYREKFIQSRKPLDYVSPSDALASGLHSTHDY